MAITIFIWLSHPLFVLGQGRLSSSTSDHDSDWPDTFKGRASFETPYKLLKCKELNSRSQKTGIWMAQSRPKLVQI
jgi:hypothetical protein